MGYAICKQNIPLMGSAYNQMSFSKDIVYIVSGSIFPNFVTVVNNHETPIAISEKYFQEHFLEVGDNLIIEYKFDGLLADGVIVGCGENSIKVHFPDRMEDVYFSAGDALKLSHRGGK